MSLCALPTSPAPSPWPSVSPPRPVKPNNSPPPPDLEVAALTLEDSISSADVYAYLDARWADLEAWHKDAPTAASASITVEEAVYAYEGLINAYGTDPQADAPNEFQATAIAVPQPNGDWETGTWTGTEALALYNDIVTAVNAHIAAGPGTNTVLHALDVVVDDLAATPTVWVQTLTQEVGATAPGDPVPIYPWADEQDIVLPPYRRTFSCASPLFANDIIESELARQLEISTSVPSGRALAVSLGASRLEPTPTRRYRPNLYTKDYPTGSTDPLVRGRYLNHADHGDEILCFGGDLTNDYINDGMTLASTVMQPLVPEAFIRGPQGKASYLREPFAAVYVGKTGAPPSGQSTTIERAHDAVIYFGVFGRLAPGDAEPCECQVLEPFEP